MAQIEFLYKGDKAIIQCQYKEKFKDILQKLILKLNINLDKVSFLYSGKMISNFDSTINTIIESIDKNNNKMTVQIVDIEKEENDLIINSPQIICPDCKEKAKINLTDYRIKIFDCINKHEYNNILLEEFDKTQKINISKIICDECKIKNKGNYYKKIFYRCITCKKNLCPICKDKHLETHNIINYDEKNYICDKHNYPYSLYCYTCKDNICILCENEHDEHKTISFGKIIPNKNILKNNMKEFKNKVDLFKKNTNEIIDKLNKIINSVEKLYNICEHIIKNNTYKNYECLYNIKKINFEQYIKDLNAINQENNAIDKFEKMMGIYDKIMNIYINKEVLPKIRNNNFHQNNMGIPFQNNNNFNNNLFNNFNNNLNLQNNNLSFTNENKQNSESSENTIFIIFTFKKNKKQIYIDAPRNIAFSNAINMLEKKYEWLKSISIKNYTFNNKIIKTNDYNKTLLELGIDDDSEIFILEN